MARIILFRQLFLPEAQAVLGSFPLKATEKVLPQWRMIFEGWQNYWEANEQALDRIQ